MAELAFSAVRSLLGLLGEEAQQLVHVSEDVRFIQEEMESMASFLEHLDETRPPNGEHRPPVRSWMKQVRDVAFDCSNCIDLYVRKGRGRLAAAHDSGTFVGFLQSLPWSMALGTALLAQRDAAAQIRKLKVRVQDVSERRHRYGVELPKLEENNDRQQQQDLVSQVAKQQPMFMMQLPKIRATDGEADPVQQPTCIIQHPMPKMGDVEADPMSGGTISMEAVVSVAFGGSKDVGSGGTEAVGGGHYGSGARPAMVVNDDKQQTTFIIQLSVPKMTDNRTDPVSSGGTVAAVAADLGGGKNAGSGGTESAGMPSQIEGSHGGDHGLVKKDDKQQLKYIIQLSTQTAVGTGRGPIMVVSDDVIREALVFSEPNILEENTKKLVKLLTSHIHHGSRGEPGGHDSNCGKATEAAEGKGPRPLPPLDNIICVAAMRKEDGGDLVRQVLHVHGDVARVFEKVITLQLDFVSLFVSLSFYEQLGQGLWFILRFLLDYLLPFPKPKDSNEALKDIKEKDNWDEAKIAQVIGEQMKLKGNTSLFVIQGNVTAGRLWDLIKEALGKFGCAAGSALIVVTDKINADKLRLERGVIRWPLVTHSLVDYWSTKALAVLSRSSRTPETGQYLRRSISILHQIQDRCEPQAFCMKMFVHYLCANLSKSKEELDELLVRRLVSTGNLPPDSSDATEIREANGKILLKFCYDDLPRPYRSCLLYLAIFPPGRSRIWQSRLVMRWIVEGLITGRGMRRAMFEAERCFDTLVNRGFVCPEDISASRKVRACSIPDSKLMQEFINDGAKEEQFLDPRLSHHLAQHFSIHCGLQLRRSDNIQDFILSLGKKSRSSNRSIVYQPQLNLIKVLDLECCEYLKNHKPRNLRLLLKNICKNMLLLKYLSIRNTGVDSLPKKINNLLHLEILDIRQTRVPSNGTKDIMLPKLKCLLAGHIQTPSTGMAEKPVPSVQIPSKINTMPNMEVLSHVNSASHDADVLEHIGRLWQLRKLGVVIDGNIEGWFAAIGNLNECLRSLSIHIKNQAAEGQSVNLAVSLPHFHLELLEKLRISGRTSGELLPLFFESGQHNPISKVTLRDTLLTHSTLEAHLKNLSNLQCLKLRYESYNQKDLIFNQHVFPKLKFLIVECGKITRIKFLPDAAPMLEKIVWSFTKMKSLSGITNVSVLKELVLKGDENATVMDQVRKDIAGHPNSPVLECKPAEN